MPVSGLDYFRPLPPVLLLLTARRVFVGATAPAFLYSGNKEVSFQFGIPLGAHDTGILASRSANVFSPQLNSHNIYISMCPDLFPYPMSNLTYRNEPNRLCLFVTNYDTLLIDI